MSTLDLPGLDPLDPLGFLAALGVLAAATDDAAGRGSPPPKLSFAVGPRPQARLHSRLEDLESLVAMLIEDLEAVAGRPDATTREPFLDFSYEDDKGKPVHDLKPPPSELREFASTQLAGATAASRRTVDWLSAVLTDAAVDGKGASKPFALHFTAGNQRFLNVALELVDGTKQPGVNEDDLTHALRGPWKSDRPLKVFSWSPKQDRAYALRAVDPSDDSKLGDPGADWLAFRGLPLLSSAPRREGDSVRIHTAGVRGGWKNASFTYPVWPQPLDAHGVRALLRHPALVSDDSAATAVWPATIERWTCRITRSEQGGYGAFSRPHRIPARTRHKPE